MIRFKRVEHAYGVSEVMVGPAGQVRLTEDFIDRRSTDSWTVPWVVSVSDMVAARVSLQGPGAVNTLRAWAAQGAAAAPIEGLKTGSTNAISLAVLGGTVTGMIAAGVAALQGSAAWVGSVLNTTGYGALAGAALGLPTGGYQWGHLKVIEATDDFLADVVRLRGLFEAGDLGGEFEELYIHLHKTADGVHPQARRAWDVTKTLIDVAIAIDPFGNSPLNEEIAA